MDCIEVGTIIYASVKNIEATSVALRKKLVPQAFVRSKGVLYSKSLTRLSKSGTNNIWQTINYFWNKIFADEESILTSRYSIQNQGEAR